jgi:hypothetical protein
LRLGTSVTGQLAGATRDLVVVHVTGGRRVRHRSGVWIGGGIFDWRAALACANQGGETQPDREIAMMKHENNVTHLAAGATRA